MSEEIYVEREGAIATVVLNRPERHNAMNLTLYQGLHRHLSELDADAEVRCVVLRGAGGRAFSAGADISEFEQHRASAEGAKRYAELSHPAMAMVERCRHPVIALIEGLAVGGGFAIAVASDLRVCGESSRFGVPVKRLGLVENHEELMPLVRKFGPNVALEVLLVGDVFGAADALRMGLVNKVVPDGQVAEEAYAIARRIAEGAPLSARWHKRFVYRLLDPSPLSEAEREEGYACFDTEDFRIGYKAFLAKQTPRFVGR